MIVPHARIIPLLAAIIVLCAGCASAPTASEKYREREAARVKAVFARIDELNRTEKKSSAWLTTAYASLGIKNVHDIPPESYAGYGRFVRNGDVYIVVHPGYFPFFDTWSIPRPPADYSGGYPVQNVLERVTGNLPKDDIAFRAAREQEQVLRDFLEFQSVEQGLVVLILPRDYKQHVTYGSVAGYDEYARYLNEITNAAESIVFIESDTHYSGKLLDSDLRLLSRFLKAAGARTLLLGGNFMGRCLEGTYHSLNLSMFRQDLSYVPELTAFSPADLKADKADILTGNGKLDAERRERYFLRFAFNSATEKWLPWKHLPLYDVYQAR